MTVDEIIEVLKRQIDALDRRLEIRLCTFFLLDRLLPVPLVDVDRMQVVEFLVAADGVHIGVNTVPRADPVAADRHALPLSQRLHNFRLMLFHIKNRKINRSFHAVQVVVQTALGQYDQRSADTAQVQAVSDFLLKIILDLFDRALRFHVIKNRRVVFRDE